MIDQGLKERLTGAVVLVLLGVIFIPLFLDGPDAKTEGRQKRALDLPGVSPSKVEPTPRPSPKTSPDSSSSDPAKDDSVQAEARGPVQKTVADQVANSNARPAAPPAGNDAARPAMVIPDNPLSAWAVQVGSFSSQDNAERLSADLKKRGYRAFVTRLTTKNRTLYRVRVGPEQERERAELLARRLKKDGQAADVVTHP